MPAYCSQLNSMNFWDSTIQTLINVLTKINESCSNLWSKFLRSENKNVLKCFFKSKIKFSPQKITENGIVTVSTEVNSRLNKFSFMSMKKIPENLKISSIKVKSKIFLWFTNFTQFHTALLKVYLFVLVYL